jgi:hypothetical protein
MRPFIDKVFYRAAAAPLTALPTIAGTYPTATISGWTEIVGEVAEKAKMGRDAEGKSAMGDGTEYVGSEKAPVGITVKNISVANYATLRTAFLNTKVDIFCFDNNNRAVGYAAHGIRVYPKFEMESGEEPQIVIGGERKAASSVAGLFVPLGT